MKCPEHKKSTQLNRDFKIISSLHSKARHGLPSTELLAYIFDSVPTQFIEKLQEPKVHIPIQARQVSRKC